MDLQLWTISKLTRLAYSLRRDVRFYAPLQDHLDFFGVEPVTFTRTGAANATWRDGATHSVPANNPRFEYSSELPRGILLVTGEVLQYAAANALDNANTLIWFEEGVPKSTPSNANPFSSSGIWTGNLNIHVKHIVKAARVLTNTEINQIQSILEDVAQVITAPLPPGAISGSFFQEVPSGARNGSNVTFTISNAPQIDSLLLFYGGVAFERVAAAPGEMQFTLSVTTITMGLAPESGITFFCQYIVL